MRRANGKHGLSTIILRGGLFYHAESIQTQRLINAIRRRLLPVFGPGNNIISNIHADDMAGAVVAALEKPAPGETFFVTDDHPIAFREYVNTIASLVGARPARHWPNFLAPILLGPVMGILPRIYFNCPNAKFKKATGWQPQYPDLHSGMRQVLSQIKLMP